MDVNCVGKKTSESVVFIHKYYPFVLSVVLNVPLNQPLSGEQISWNMRI